MVLFFHKIIQSRTLSKPVDLMNFNELESIRPDHPLGGMQAHRNRLHRSDANACQWEQMSDLSNVWRARGFSQICLIQLVLFFSPVFHFSCEIRLSDSNSGDLFWPKSSSEPTETGKSQD